uniref:Uncharacterized protein n=1 Tax=Cacopsylla melanoneura TaxID=428564 RepID=A0A8D9ATM1_9HEMI
METSSCHLSFKAFKSFLRIHYFLSEFITLVSGCLIDFILRIIVSHCIIVFHIRHSRDVQTVAALTCVFSRPTDIPAVFTQPISLTLVSTFTLFHLLRRNTGLFGKISGYFGRISRSTRRTRSWFAWFVHRFFYRIFDQSFFFFFFILIPTSYSH